MELSHLDPKGKAIMVDISKKAPTEREAIASAVVNMQAETLKLITGGGIKKGDVFSVARIAGILAAKKTADLIPLCHPLPITASSIEFEIISETQLKIIAKIKTNFQTGVEMEALTAVSVAGLTVYDMCKAVDRAMSIESILLEKKTGGKSGTFDRKENT